MTRLPCARFGQAIACHTSQLPMRPDGTAPRGHRQPAAPTSEGAGRGPAACRLAVAYPSGSSRRRAAWTDCGAIGHARVSWPARTEFGAVRSAARLPLLTGLAELARPTDVGVYWHLPTVRGMAVEPSRGGSPAPEGVCHVRDARTHASEGGSPA